MSSTGDRAALLKHTSMHKGLTNHTGQNNCFLNVIIQSLWHLDSFRVLIKSSDHTTFHTIHDTCLLCELKEIFTYYEFSEENALAPDNVRLALNVLSRQSDRFQLGAMADATETLDTILNLMHQDQCRHVSLVNSKPLESSLEMKDVDCEPKCIAHALFESNMFDMYHCTTCQAMSDPDMWKDTLYRIYFSELYQHVATSSQSRSTFFFGGNSPTSSSKHSFESVLKKLLNEGPQKSCPENELTKCSGRCRVERWLMKFPIVFAVSIVWPSNTINGNELRAFANVIPHQLDLSLIFRMGGDAAGKSKTESIYLFRGMVCYYGQHYVSFFKSQSISNQWYLFDDVHVHKVGGWDEVRRRIERGCYQPTILFWEKNQLAYEQLEEIAQHVHQPLSPRSPRVAESTPQNVSMEPPIAIKLSPPKNRHANLACHVFTNNAVIVAEGSPPKRGILKKEDEEALQILETLEELDRAESPQRATKTVVVVQPPSWEIIEEPVPASFDGSCLFTVRLTPKDGGIGLVIGSHEISLKLVVETLETSATGVPLPAMSCQVISIGDQLIQIDEDVIDEKWTSYQAMERLITTATPVTLTFARLVPWICQQCTLINEIGSTKCNACDRPKPPVDLVRSPHAAKNTKDVFV